MLVAQISRQSLSRDYAAEAAAYISTFAITAFPYLIEAE